MQTTNKTAITTCIFTQLMQTFSFSANRDPLPIVEIPSYDILCCHVCNFFFSFFFTIA